MTSSKDAGLPAPTIELPPARPPVADPSPAPAPVSAPTSVPAPVIPGASAPVPPPADPAPAPASKPPGKDPIDAIIFGMEDIIKEPEHPTQQQPQRIEKTTYGKIKEAIAWFSCVVAFAYVFLNAQSALVHSAVGYLRTEERPHLLEFNAGAEHHRVHSVHHPHAALHLAEAHGTQAQHLRAHLQHVSLRRLLPRLVFPIVLKFRLDFCVWISVQVYIYNKDSDAKDSMREC